MIARRDVLFGGGLLVAAGAAAALTPRKNVVLLPAGRELESMIPKTIGSWQAVPSDLFVLPKTEGSLADKLYNQTVTRLYESPTALPVMLVMAYGSIQNDALQLHRPETCYAAVGFQISSSRVDAIDVGGRAKVPVRELTATAERRIEPIIYWTRIGDSLPTSGREQRVSKLEQQFEGIIPDGILVRMSTVAEPDEATFAALRGFASAMLTAVAPADRAVLVGTTISGRLR
ncbi:exosortase-associated protein EpsI, V-type [Glacieibacterium frigidum]|uniref:EpsI family protein n=1 Tax=Glacieibacterium frigidum TaxID=2593303 RepID=A0A552UIB8_9SPHN|nr:exosortase-associated protein EpsI, V-type [Glacieibacterium frigidum]TRW17965.1 EpsI family protein [Glacieibacterium frigidum]